MISSPARALLLKEVEGLSQAQADWRPGDTDWSVGEIVHHLTLAEVGTGKVTSKVLKDAGETVKPFPADLKGFTPIVDAGGRPGGCSPGGLARARQAFRESSWRT